MHLADKPEHAITLDTGAVVTAERPPADQGDIATLPSIAFQLATVEVVPSAEAPTELVTNKGTIHAR